MLPAGSELDSKYKAELVEHPHMANCYISRLTVRGVGLRDSRPYTLMVENKHGRDTVPVLLSIKGEVDGVQGGFCSSKPPQLVKLSTELSSTHLSSYLTQFFKFPNPDDMKKGNHPVDSKHD